MRQYDVFANPSLRSRREHPYVVVLQHHIIDELATILAAPLAQLPVEHQARRITPIVEFDGRRLVLLLPLIAPVEVRLLKEPLGDLDDLHDVIRPAIDRLFNGV